MILGNTNNDVNEEINFFNLFKENQVDGILFIATIFTQRHRKLLKECKVPVVILGQRLEGYSCVYHDDYHAALDVTKLLLKGSRVPAYIGVTSKDEAVGMQRSLGFEEAVKFAGLTCPPEHRKQAQFRMESGYEKMKELYEEAPQIDAVFCATDSIAIGAMMYLKEQKVKIPEQVRLVGIGDSSLSRLVEPKLTTVHFHYKTSGVEAAAMLLELLNHKENGVQKEVRMGYTPVQHESTCGECTDVIL